MTKMKKNLKKDRKTINLYESFAGIGSQHKALTRISQMQGFDVNLVGITEWDMYAVLAYLDIHYPGEYTENNRNSSGLTDKEIREHFKNRTYSKTSKDATDISKNTNIKVLRKLYYAEQKLNNNPNIMEVKGADLAELDIDLFTYSFPCQDLSVAGLGKGLAKDSETRSGLLWEIERILDEINEINQDALPNMLLLENVIQLFSGDHKQHYEQWKNKLSELGYVTIEGVLDARDFGIPQSRKRAFAISFLRSSVDKDFITSLENELSFKEIKKQDRNSLKLGNFIMHNYNDTYYYKEAIASTPNHTKSRIGMFEKEKRILDYNENNVPVFNESGYTNTITTKQDRWHNAGMLAFREKVITEYNGEILPHPRPSDFRYLTPRETYLLMGFEESDFNNIDKSIVTDTKLYRQAGNSIVVNVLEAIFNTYIPKFINHSTLEKFKIERRK